jgi:hypothetical protein
MTLRMNAVYITAVIVLGLLLNLLLMLLLEVATPVR